MMGDEYNVVFKATKTCIELMNRIKTPQAEGSMMVKVEAQLDASAPPGTKTISVKVADQEKKGLFEKNSVIVVGDEINEVYDKEDGEEGNPMTIELKNRMVKAQDERSPVYVVHAFLMETAE